jgi:hypothetical protein
VTIKASTEGIDFDTWVDEFVELLTPHVSFRQADKFRHTYRNEAMNHYRDGLTPEQAVAKELL